MGLRSNYARRSYDVIAIFKDGGHTVGNIIIPPALVLDEKHRLGTGPYAKGGLRGL